MNIQYIVQVWREEGQYIAHGMPLDVMSSGSSPEAARRALEEAVGVFLQTAADAGTLEDVLNECGYVQEEHAWRAPEWVGVQSQSVPVML